MANLHSRRECKSKCTCAHMPATQLPRKPAHPFATVLRHVTGSRAAANVLARPPEPTVRSPAARCVHSARHAPNKACGRPDEHENSITDPCRRTGTKGGEPNAYASCSGHRADSGDNRGSQNCARNEEHCPSAFGPLKRSLRWGGTYTCWAACSSGWSSANAISSRRKGLSRPSAQLLRKLWTAAQHEQQA